MINAIRSPIGQAYAMPGMHHAHSLDIRDADGQCFWFDSDFGSVQGEAMLLLTLWKGL